MKFFIVLTGLMLFITPAYNQSKLQSYLNGRYPLQFVDKIPGNASQRIIIVSTRNIITKPEYSIRKGIHPRYKVFWFVAGIRNDTAFLQPLHTLNEALPLFPEQNDYLIYVDGHGKTFPQAMERGFEINRRFKINVVVFDWPSDYLALRKTVYNANDVAVTFVETMQAISALKKSSFPDADVSVIFHSMGNRILKNISHPALLKHMPEDLFTNIIINAAAVKRQNHARWVERLNIQKRVYITLNETDFNLRGATILRLAEQLGNGIMGRKMTAKNALYIDFNKIATIEHNLFLEKPGLEEKNPDIFLVYDMAFHGKEIILPVNSTVQILRPSERSFLFSDKKSIRESP